MTTLPKLATVLLLAGWTAAGSHATAQAQQAAAATAVSDSNALYAQARAALAPLPPMLATLEPWLMANSEERGGNAQGDFNAAFAAARALRVPDGGSADPAIVARMVWLKTQIEPDAVNQALFEFEFARAQSLAHRADVPHAPLYAALIRAGMDPNALSCASVLNATQMRGGAAAIQAARDASPTALAGCPDNQDGAQPQGTSEAGVSGYDPLTLARECFTEDGTFPYGALWTAYQALPAETGGGDGLVREIATRAAGDPEPSADAVDTLYAIHAAEPRFDALLADSAGSALLHLHEAVQRLPSGSNSAALDASGHRLLALLTQLDPARTNELSSKMPEFVAAAAPATPASGFPGRCFTSSADLVAAQEAAWDAASTGAAPAALPCPALQRSPGLPANLGVTPQMALDSTELERARNIDTLVDTAMARHAPRDQALQAAAQADSLVDDGILRADPDDVISRLATVEDGLGMNAQSRAMLERWIAVADRSAAAFDQSWAAMTPAQQAAAIGPAIALQLRWAYNTASQLDHALAVHAATQSSAVLLKPLLLIAAAGEVTVPRPSGITGH